VPGINARLVGVELYFDHLESAREFYGELLGLPITAEALHHHLQFEVGPAFFCAEKKGGEDYPSQDKAVLFLQVPSVADAVQRIGTYRVVRYESGAETGSNPWAVLHDPEGHNIILLEATVAAQPE
jgi:hypothetical protein